MLDTLIEQARQASDKAHAPYSEFHVGAALLGTDDNIYVGCNVECSSFGGTICAERSALVSAVSAGCKSFKTLVVFTPTEEPTPPCGICRQLLSDFAPELEIVSVCKNGKQKVYNLKDLLPHAFTL